MEKIKYDLYASKLKRCPYNENIVVGGYSCITCIHCENDDIRDGIILCSPDKIVQKKKIKIKSKKQYRGIKFYHYIH